MIRCQRSQRRMPPKVRGFGRRPFATVMRGAGAGVRKPPRRKPRGGRAPCGGARPIWIWGSRTDCVCRGWIWRHAAFSWRAPTAMVPYREDAWVFAPARRSEGDRRRIECVSSAKVGHGLAGLGGFAEVGFLVLPEVVHIEVTVGFEPVLVGFDG